MIAAMLTLVVAALLMVVALMFAAEIGWLMIDPTPPSSSSASRQGWAARHALRRAGSRPKG